MTDESIRLNREVNFSNDVESELDIIYTIDDKPPLLLSILLGFQIGRASCRERV